MGRDPTPALPCKGRGVPGGLLDIKRDYGDGGGLQIRGIGTAGLQIQLNGAERGKDMIIGRDPTPAPSPAWAGSLITSSL